MRLDAEVVQHPETAHVREAEIEDDRVGRIGIDPPQRLEAARGFIDGIAFESEGRAKLLSQVLVIFDDQQRATRHVSGYLKSGRLARNGEPGGARRQDSAWPATSRAKKEAAGSTGCLSCEPTNGVFASLGAPFEERAELA